MLPATVRELAARLDTNPRPDMNQVHLSQTGVDEHQGRVCRSGEGSGGSEWRRD